MALLDFITKPLRGIGRMVGGVLDLNPKRFGRGLADVGSAAKSAAPILGLTGVGAPLAAVIGGVGGLAEAASPEYRGDLGDAISGAVTGAAGGLAGHYARGPLGIGRVAAGAPTAVATEAIPTAAATAGMPADVAAESVLSPAWTAPAASAGAAPGGAALTSLKPGGVGARNIGRQILDFARKRPEIALGVLSTAADMYQGEQEGEAQDRLIALQEQRMRPRMPYDEWERNRMRGGR